LPAAWRSAFDGVELPFAQVPALPGGPIWPKSVFRAFHDLAPARVRAVIFGNDPYTKVEQATGRSFEQGDVTDWKTQFRTKRVSPSLRNIVIAAMRTKPAYAARSGLHVAQAIASGEIALPADLFAGWASQGVLWLNRTLTFSVWDDRIRDTHKRLWAPFTQRAIEVLRTRRVAFVLWGGIAQELEKAIGDATIVKAGHPQMSAGFFKLGNPLAAINAAIGPPGIGWL